MSSANTTQSSPSWTCRPCADESGGSALIVAIWIIGLLSLLISSFAFDMQIQGRITSYSRKKLKAEYLARAGIEKTKMLMNKAAELKGQTVSKEEDQSKAWYGPASRLGHGQAINELTIKLGEGEIVLDIIPEPARLSINSLTTDDPKTREIWDGILQIDGVPEDMRPALIDCFFDWTNPGDNPRVNGAKSDDYYLTLKLPYRCKNGPLDTVEELLLIKGFTREIVFGGLPPDAGEDEQPLTGMADLLSPYGDGKINVNAASTRVLMTLPGVDDVMAQEIIASREGTDQQAGTRTKETEASEDYSFKSTADFLSRFPDLRKDVADRISIDSTVYRIVSKGKVHGVQKGIWCVVTFSGGAMTVMRWWEEEAP